MKSIMKQRVNQLESACERMKENGSDFNSINRSKLDHIIVNDKYKVMYCYVPKVACTNLKRVFLILTGKLNVTDPLQLSSGNVHSVYSDEYLSYLDSYSASEIKHRLTHYKKVLFVREPLERLLSAFRNKFVDKGNTYFKVRFGKQILKLYRGNSNKESQRAGTGVLFPEFVQFLLDPNTEERGYNEHWRPFFDLCFPCHVHYDYIGKYETLEDDVDGLLQLLHVDDFIKFPRRNATYKALKTEDLFLKFYKSVDPYMLGEIIDVYQKDYAIFDYHVPDSIQRLLRNKD